MGLKLYFCTHKLICYRLNRKETLCGGAQGSGVEHPTQGPGDRDPYNKLKYLERDLVLAGGTAGECGAEVLVPHDELHYAAG